MTVYNCLVVLAYLVVAVIIYDTVCGVSVDIFVMS